MFLINDGVTLLFCFTDTRDLMPTHHGLLYGKNSFVAEVTFKFWCLYLTNFEYILLRFIIDFR